MRKEVMICRTGNSRKDRLGEAYVSKTDKTNPLWVKLLQNPEWREERHNHYNGVCDVQPITHDFHYPHTSCGYWVSNLGTQHVWVRPREHEQLYRIEANGKTRNDLRMAMREIMKMTRDDIEDCEFLSYPHRHQALWDAW